MLKDFLKIFFKINFNYLKKYFCKMYKINVIKI